MVFESMPCDAIESAKACNVGFALMAACICCIHDNQYGTMKISIDMHIIKTNILIKYGKDVRYLLLQLLLLLFLVIKCQQDSADCPRFGLRDLDELFLLCGGQCRQIAFTLLL